MLLTHHTPDGVRRSRHQSLSLYGLPDGVESPRMLDSLAEIVRLARAFTDADGAAVNLLPDGRQVTLAATSADAATEIPEEHSVCAVLLEQRPMTAIVVRDLATDHRFAENPYVNGQISALRGYAIAPLLGHERVAIGTLCLWSFAPRALSRDQGALLDQLANAAVKVLDDARRDRRMVQRFPERRLGTRSTPSPAA